MSPAEPIGNDEVILRRIPPTTIGMDSTKQLPNGRLRATSVRLSTRDGEHGLSCTRLIQTSPQELLNGLVAESIDPTGWLVCRLLVSEVRQLGLEVIHKPTLKDTGHCEILGADGVLQYPNSHNSKLAKKSLILTNEEVSTLKAGDRLS